MNNVLYEKGRDIT